MRNRTRISSLDAFGLRDQRDRIYPTLEASDGSTLSLDFTSMGGALDSRFTFSRSSTATVINSSGLVQYADHNLVANSAFAGSNMGNGWVQNGAAATNSGTGTLTFSVTTAAVSYASRSIATAVGLRYSAAVNVSSITGTIQYQEVLAIGGTISNTQMYRNGSSVSASDPAQPGLISITWTSGASNFIRFGVGASGNNQTNVTVAVDTPRAIAGAVAQPAYFVSPANDSYYAPRFDYDPTTLARRGLLIEGSATNLVSYSEDFSNAAWTKSGTNSSMPQIGTAPDNNATSRLFEENTTSFAKHSLERSISISAGIHTFSVWLKEPTSNSRRYAHIQLADGQATAARYTIVVDVQTGTITANGVNNGTAGAPTDTAHSITAYPNGWYRVTISMNHVASPSYQVVMLGDSSALFGGNNQPFYSATTPYKGLLVWGAQLEAGSYASSYIPTGASTAQRASELCQMIGTNFSSWFQAGNAYSMLYRYSLNSPTAWAGFNIDRACGQVSVNAGGNRTFIYAAYRVANGSVDIGRFVRVLDTGSLDMAPATKPAALTNTALAFAVNTNDAAIYGTNGVVGTDSSCTILTGQNLLDIGAIGSSQHLNGCISLIKYWPTRLPNATLQSLTA